MLTLEKIRKYEAWFIAGAVVIYVVKRLFWYAGEFDLDVFMARRAGVPESTIWKDLGIYSHFWDTIFPTVFSGVFFLSAWYLFHYYVYPAISEKKFDRKTFILSGLLVLSMILSIYVYDAHKLHWRFRYDEHEKIIGFKVYSFYRNLYVFTDTIALFVTFLPESSGEFIRSLPMAVITTVLASLFVSFTIVPFLASLLMPKEEKEEGNIILQFMKKGIEGSYRKILHWSLNHPAITLLIAVLVFVGSLSLIPVIGISVFPKSEKPQFLINIETPIGVNISETNQVARFVEAELSKHEVVKNFTTNVGKGNPRIYYNVIPPGGAISNFAQLFVQLQEATEVPERTEFIDLLRKKFKIYPGAKIQVIEFEQGPPVEAPLSVRIFGDNLDSLRSIAFKVEKAYKATEGTIYINNPMSAINTDLRVKINQDKAGLMGIPTSDIDRTIRMGISGINIGSYKSQDADDVQINVGLPRTGKPDVSVFDKMFIANPSGIMIPLSQLASVAFETSPNKINHYDQERYTTVSSFVANGYLTPAVNQAFQEKLAKIDIPAGYSIKTAGELERQQETFGGLGTIIIITIFGILAILILEFRTFKSSFIVLSVIPLGVIGAVGILFLTGNSLSFTAVVGIIALAGIEVKNSILLVDYTNYLRKHEGLTIDEAIEKAGETRFIPIVLTTMTAIGGLVPLVMEHSPLYSPLALVIIGGLISSLILTRIVTPVMYKLLPPKI
jgi:multidrug efflux pump subunit AcrB